MAHCPVGSSNLHCDTPQHDRMNLISNNISLRSSYFVPHKLKDQKHVPNHKTTPTSFKGCTQACGVLAFVLFPPKSNSVICMMQMEMGFIRPQDLMPMLNYSILMFLCKLEMFSHVNCIQQRCLNRPSASVSYTANRALRENLR